MLQYRSLGKFLNGVKVRKAVGEEDQVG